MAYSHCMGTGPEQVQGTEPGAMGPNISCRNVHTGLRQGKEKGSVVSYCAGPVPCTCSLVNKPLNLDTEFYQQK